MKKSIYTYIGLAMVGLMATSCEKVIDIDLNSSASKVVIVGSITDQLGPDTIKITRTINFDEDNDFPGVTGATVTISDNAGNSEVLIESSPGVYHTTAIQGTPGRTYTLVVEADGETYTAFSTMPVPLPIDTITVTNSFFGDGKIVQVKVQDPAGVDNFYSVIGFQNGLRSDETNYEIGDDRLLDGDLLTFAFFFDSDELNSGDTLRYQLQTIDKGVYDFYRTFNELANAEQSSSPANPQSNISNGALGYFSAYAATERIYIYP